MSDIGYVYCFSNLYYDNMYKIGFTENDPQLRANQLRKTGVVGRFKVEFFIKIKQYREMEKHIHSLLDKYRVEADREFFKIDISIIKFIFDLIEGKISKNNKIENEVKISDNEIKQLSPTKPKTEVLEKLNENKQLSLTKPKTEVLEKLNENKQLSLTKYTPSKVLDDIYDDLIGLYCINKPYIKHFNVIFEYQIYGKIMNNIEKTYFIKKFDVLSGKEKHEIMKDLFLKDDLETFDSLLNRFYISSPDNIYANTYPPSNAKKDNIIERLMFFDLSLLIDIANVNIYKHYETYLIFLDKSQYTYTFFSYIFSQNLHIPEKYLTDEILIRCYINGHCDSIPEQLMSEEMVYLHILKYYKNSYGLRGETERTTCWKSIPEKYKTNKICTLYAQKYGRQNLSDMGMTEEEIRKIDIKICGIMFFDEAKASQINEGSICLRIIRDSYWYSNSYPEIITKNIIIMMVRRYGKKCFSFHIDDEIIKDPICELALKYCDNN